LHGDGIDKGIRMSSRSPRPPFILIILLLTGCSSLFPQPTSTPEPSSTPQPSLTSTPTAEPTSTPTLTLEPVLTLISPLEGFSFEQLHDILSNPFVSAHITWDDGHQGIDLSFYRYGDIVGIEGLPIHAILGGTVAAVVNNRTPYGNMIIIETPLSEIPEAWQAVISIPTPAPTVTSDGRLTCPEGGPSPTFVSTGSRSLYILYGHMLNPPEFEVGDTGAAGQEIGQGGNTGESSGPHLHLETRYGPSGARFTTIAHRDTSVTAEEMNNYCVWRISELFQAIDPFLLLDARPD